MTTPRTDSGGRLRAWSRDPRVGWGAWFVVVLGALNAGAPHAVAHRFFEQLGRDQFVLTPRSAPVALASMLTDDGDVRRYYAYANAALGRPYPSYFVRPMAAWMPEFESGQLPPDADTFPLISPSRPLLPYRDYLVEYPPSFFAWALPLALPAPNEDVFRFLFCTAMAVSLALCIRICQRLSSLLDLNGEAADSLPFWIVVGCACIGLVSTHRFDALVALLLCATCWALVTRRPFLLGAAFGGAIAVKLVPAVAAPVIVVALIQERRWRDLAISVTVALAIVGALYLPAMELAGSQVFDVVRYHAGRPLQVESTFAAFLGVWRTVEPGSLWPVWSYGSSNVAGTHAMSAARLATPLTAVGLLCVCASLWRRLRSESDLAGKRRTIVAHLVASLVVFMIFGKVFSPQYLIWILPLGVLLSRLAGGYALTLLLLVFGLTQLIFPTAYRAVQDLELWSSAIILLRNGLLAVWAVKLMTVGLAFSKRAL